MPHLPADAVDLDPLSETLGPLRCRLFEQLELRQPWGIGVPDATLAFYAFFAGRGHLSIERTSGEIDFSPGDLIVLPQALAHRLQDAPNSPLVPINELLPSAVSPRLGDGQPVVRLVACHLAIPRHGSTLLHSALPPVIRVPGVDGQAAPWLRDTLQLMSLESESPRRVSQGILDRLGQVIILQAIRAFLCESAAKAAHSPSALLDPSIAGALSLIHRYPERPWTVAALASEVAMSRSAFADRFAELVGAAPIEYLTERRMQAACRLLRDPEIGLSQIAARVGYRSTAAFSNAFRRSVGVAPGRYRRAPSLIQTPQRRNA
jgi:AraC-like DNA-binding protein